MPQLTLRERLKQGETVLGTFQFMRSPMATEALGLAGLDFVIIDQEHGPLSAERSLQMCYAAENGGTCPVVRVRRNDEAEVQRALDIGASGVEIPQIETKADAQDAVNASRFAPLGERGLTPYVRAGKYTGGPQYTEKQNEKVTLIIHIEGTKGVENLDEILSVEGIDVIFIGPYDLSQSLGIPGQVMHESVKEMMKSVCKRASEAGKLVGTFAETPETAQQWIDIGVQYVGYKVDVTILLRQYESLMTKIET